MPPDYCAQMKILIVEDDASNADYLERAFREAGHQSVVAETGTHALAHALGDEFDAIVLDRMLPEIDGLSLLRTLRAENKMTPVILLSALGQLDHRVEGLRAGADDYLVKPFAFSELLLRVETIAKRKRSGPDETTEMTVGDLTLDRLSRTAQRNGRQIDLQPKEYQILEYLMRNAGRIVTRTMLLEGVWDYQFDPQTNVVDVHISRLRKKVDGEQDQALIHTVHGAGYRIVA